MQGRAGAAASDALAETGKGFVNFMMILGVIESVVLDQAENRIWAQMYIQNLLCNEVAWETYWELR